jgi:hypothetical protein
MTWLMLMTFGAHLICVYVYTHTHTHTHRGVPLCNDCISGVYSTGQLKKNVSYKHYFDSALLLSQVLD